MVKVISIDEANTPELRPSSVMSPRMASAEDFGSGVGSALSVLGDTGMKIATMFQQDQERLRNFTLEKQFTDFSSEESTRLADASRGIADGGKDFMRIYTTGSGGAADEAHAQSDGGFDGRASKWLSDNTSGLSEAERAKWEARVASLRKTVQGAALSTEFKERDRFYKTNISDMLQKFSVGIGSAPPAFDAYLKQGNDVIDASGLSPADKEALKSKWQDDAALAYGVAISRTNPDAVATILGSDKAGYFARLKNKESGNNPDAKAATSSARGLYQFTQETWNAVASTEAGRAAGLTPGGIGDPTQQEIAARLFTKSNAEALAAAGVSPDEKNLYMAHFMGAAGAKQFIAAMQANPLASAAEMFPKAAAANKSVFYDKQGNDRSLAQVYALQTAGFGGNSVTLSDKVLDMLPLNQRLSLRDRAEREAQGQDAAVKAQAQQGYSDWWNGFQTSLHDGVLGRADIDIARKSGVLKDINDINTAERIVAQREKGVADAEAFGRMTADPSTQWNPFNKDHKDIAEAGVKALGGTAAAAFNVFDRTGIVPESAGTLLRGGLVSTDPAKIKAAANIASNIIARNPNAFAGVAGRSEIEDAATMFDHYVNGLGMSADQAAQRIAKENSPEFKRSIKVRDEDLQRFSDYLRKDNPQDDVVRAFDPHPYVPFTGRPALGVGADQRKAIMLDYAELAKQHYADYGDRDAAKAYALSQMKKLYGVSNGTLMKFPPERVYPSVDGGYKYIYDQAKAAVTEATGGKVKPDEVYLMPADGGVTSEPWRNGKPAPYALHYTYKKDGIPVHDVVPQKLFVADPVSAANAANAVSTERKKQFDKQHSTLSEVGKLRGDPLYEAATKQFP